MTPAKLATFYRLVGGDYDPLFLDTSQASLSFIYQSLGCFHTLQPEKDPHQPPTIPALTPQGFVRWQTVQLLLEPQEHVPFLQEAVKRFELTNPTDGEPFPSILPREALPSKPDQEMTEWHDAVSEKLMLEAQASQDRNMPPRPQMALSDVDVESSRPSSADSHSIDSHSIIDAASYFHPHQPTYSRPPHNNRHIDHPPPQRPPHFADPWSPLRRSSSLPNPNYQPPYNQHPYWPRQPPHPQNIRGAPRPSHARTASTLSTSSCSSSTSSSVTTSSASLSPVRYHAPLDRPDQRRHSTHHPQQRPMSRSNPLPGNQCSQPSSGPAGEGTAKNVRWIDQSRRIDPQTRNARSADGRPVWKDGYVGGRFDERQAERGRGSGRRGYAW